MGKETEREKNGRDAHVGKVGERIVEFVGLVYMCEVRETEQGKRQTRSIEGMKVVCHVPMDINI